MKAMLTLILVLSTSLSFAGVNSKKIKSVATSLAKLTADSNTYKVKPASPLEMMKDLAFNHIEYGDFVYNREDSLGGDSGVWGIHSMTTVINWVGSAEVFTLDSEGNEIQNNPKAAKAVKLIKSLKGTGVVFGAGPFGAVQCGGTYPALLMMDTEAGVIYSFETEESGC